MFSSKTELKNLKDVCKKSKIFKDHKEDNSYSNEDKVENVGTQYRTSQYILEQMTVSFKTRGKYILSKFFL